MSQDGGNNGDDPVDDLFDAIQTVHDRRVREETQTALLRQPPPAPKIRIGWIAAIGLSAVGLLALAGWIASHFQSKTSEDEKALRDAKTRTTQPSAASEPWTERASPLPAYQAPPAHREVHTPTPSPITPTLSPSARPSEPDTRNFQEEPHPSDLHIRAAPVPAPDPDGYDDPEEEAPVKNPRKPVSPPTGDTESEGFFE